MACPLQTANLLRPHAACKPTTLVAAVGKRFFSRKSIVGAPSYVNNCVVLVSCVPSRSFGQRRSSERLLRSINGSVWTGSRQAEPAKLAVPLRPLSAQTSESAITANGGLDARVNLIIRRLREDLPRQYVTEMDWSVYSPHVVFVDPVTHLRNALDAPSAIAIDAAHLRHCDTCHRGSAQGKLLYRGMIWSLRLATSALFEDGSASFELFAIEEVGANAGTIAPFSPRAVGPHVVPAVRAVRTTWATRGRSKWGTDLRISGDDVFRIGAEGVVTTHESAWNEDPAEVFDMVKQK